MCDLRLLEPKKHCVEHLLQLFRRMLRYAVLLLKLHKCFVDYQTATHTYLAWG